MANENSNSENENANFSTGSESESFSTGSGNESFSTGSESESFSNGSGNESGANGGRSESGSNEIESSQSSEDIDFSVIDINQVTWVEVPLKEKRSDSDVENSMDKQSDNRFDSDAENSMDEYGYKTACPENGTRLPPPPTPSQYTSEAYKYTKDNPGKLSEFVKECTDEQDMGSIHIENARDRLSDFMVGYLDSKKVDEQTINHWRCNINTIARAIDDMATMVSSIASGNVGSNEDDD